LRAAPGDGRGPAVGAAAGDRNVPGRAAPAAVAAARGLPSPLGPGRQDAGRNRVRAPQAADPGRDRPGSSGRRGHCRAGAPARGHAQLVTSAVLNRAQATEANSTTYTANESSPWASGDHVTGDRSSPSNDSHQCVGRYGWIALSCVIVSMTSLASAITRTAAIAPSGCSVNVEMASPSAPSAAIAAAR